MIVCDLDLAWYMLTFFTLLYARSHTITHYTHAHTHTRSASWRAYPTLPGPPFHVRRALLGVRLFAFLGRGATGSSARVLLFLFLVLVLLFLLLLFQLLLFAAFARGPTVGIFPSGRSSFAAGQWRCRWVFNSLGTEASPAPGCADDFARGAAAQDGIVESRCILSRGPAQDPPNDA